MVDEANIERVKWPKITMAASRLLAEADVRRRLLESFCRDGLFTPDVYGTDERVLRPFEPEGAATAATGPHPNITFHLHRTNVIKYEALIFQSRRAGIDLRFHPSTEPAHWPHVYELGDALASAVMPDFGTAHLQSRALDLFPAADPEVTTRRLMDAGTKVAPSGYFADGAGGLGLRTYLGSLVLDQLGRERVRSLPAPAVVVELDWGGMRVDLAPEPWTQLGPVMRDSWRRCMAHLAPAGWFSTMKLSDSGAVTLTPPDTPGWNPGGQVRLTS